MRPLLRAEQLWVTRRDGAGLNLTLTSGDRVGLLGGVADGKTALLRVLAHLQSPAGGQLWWGGTNVTRKARWRLGKQRTFVALLLANPYTSFEPWGTVRRFFAPASRKTSVVAELCRQGNLPSIVADSVVGKECGAERVRLALLWAMQHDPQVLLIDDVFRWLVPEMWQPLVDEFVAQVGDTRALVIASRYWQALQNMAYIIVLCDGVVVEEGPREAVFAQPRHAYTRQLLEQGIKELCSH